MSGRRTCTAGNACISIWTGCKRCGRPWPCRSCCTAPARWTAIRLGIRKINVGSVLKQAYFNALADACAAQRQAANPYEVIGSGLDADVLVAGRVAMQRTVEE